MKNKGFDGIERILFLLFVLDYYGEYFLGFGKKRKWCFKSILRIRLVISLI